MLLRMFLFVLFFAFINHVEASSSKGTSNPPPYTPSKTYDAKGKLLQKTTAGGRHYDVKGKYIGKTTSQGRHYDAKGRYTGKTVTGTNGSRRYDAKGKQVAKNTHKSK